MTKGLASDKTLTTKCKMLIVWDFFEVGKQVVYGWLRMVTNVASNLVCALVISRVSQLEHHLDPMIYGSKLDLLQIYLLVFFLVSLVLFNIFQAPVATFLNSLC